MDEEIDNGFTADEAAYFESEGEKVAPSLGGDAVIEADPARNDAQEPGAPEADEEGAEKKGGTVPHGAFHSEREERKKAVARVEELERNQAILNDRWNTLLSLQNGGKQEEAAKPVEDTPPDPAVDFFGYVMWQSRQMQRMQDEEVQRQQQSEAERAENQVWGAWDYSVAQARAAKPDFDQATQFLSDLREKQLEALSVVHPQFGNARGRAAQINAELRDIIVQAKNGGGDPADIIYQMAQKFGYAPNATPPVDSKNVQQETLDKVAALDEAQRASRTLGASSGTNTGDPLSAEAIASMSPTEFAAWIADPKNERLFDKLMGGDNA